ncbi:MAG: hypothetical protein LBP58_07825, partial [Azoarcus sp.]|nr:hypothetical protein [Azoarcus sp.]
MVPNQVVATVNSVKGQAFARGPDGLRPLKPGDSIHEGETLVTGDGPVVLTSDVGNPFSIPGRTEVAIAPDDEEVEMTPKQLEEIIAKLQPNLDEMDPPATGGGGPNEGHDTAEMVARVDEPIRPLRGSYRFLNDENPQDPPRPLTDPTDPPPTPPRSWQGADDNFTVKEGSTTTFDGTNNVLLNDGDGVRVGQVVSSDGSGINVLQGGTSFPTALGGTVTIYPDGHFVYTAPLRDHSDNVPDEDSFQYRAVNSNGGTSDPITVKIQIADTDPNATNDYIGDTSYTSRNTGNVITEDYGEGPDTSPAGDVIHVVAVRMGEGSTEVSVTQSSNFGNDAPTLITENGGRVWINPDGSFQYAAPQTGYDGLDSFQYKLTDTDSES